MIDSCRLYGTIKGMINHCTDDINSVSQDDENYGFSWSQFNSNYSPPHGYQSIYDSFQFKDANQLQSSNLKGQFATYDGSGYLYEMRGKLSYIQGNLTLLRQMNWIDRQTRAVIIEFSVYNPNINIVMVTAILIEFLSSGSILTTARFDTLNLFNEIVDAFSFKTFCDLVFMGFVFYFLYKQIKEATNRDFKEYIKDFWVYFEWSIILLAFISFAMILVRIKKALEVLNFFKTTSGFGYINLQTANDCNQILTYCLGLCSTFGTIKFLKMLRFNKNIAFLGLTLKLCLSELVSFSLVFLVIWLAFVQLMFFIYGTDLVGYSSFMKSMATAFQMMLGKFDSSQIMRINPLLAPLVFAMYNIVIICFTLNIFVSIITDAFDAVRFNEKENENDYHFFDHALNKFKALFNKNKSNRDSFSIQKYRSHISILPRHINRLANIIFRVNFIFSICSQKKIFQCFLNVHSK